MIRHGHAEPVGRWLAGRRPGISLDATGRVEAAGLVRALEWAPLSAVFSSPLERAIETASPPAEDHGLPVLVRPALTDIDFGDWTGKSLSDLAGDPVWQQFNRDREHACPPAGESMVAVQQRIVAELRALATCHPADTIAIVTHAEPIRCAIAAFDGLSLDAIMSTEICPAHLSALEITGTVCRVLGVNAHPTEITL